MWLRNAGRREGGYQAGGTGGRKHEGIGCARDAAGESEKPEAGSRRCLDRDPSTRGVPSASADGAPVRRSARNAHLVFSPVLSCIYKTARGHGKIALCSGQPV